jgi:hypothetical protein
MVHPLGSMRQHFLLIAEKASAMWLCHMLIYASADGYLTCFYFLTIINNVCNKYSHTNFCADMGFPFSWEYTWSYLVIW